MSDAKTHIECNACDISPQWEIRCTLKPTAAYACDDHLVMITRQLFFDIDESTFFSPRRHVRVYRWYPLGAV